MITPKLPPGLWKAVGLVPMITLLSCTSGQQRLGTAAVTQPGRNVAAEEISPSVGALHRRAEWEEYLSRHEFKGLHIAAVRGFLGDRIVDEGRVDIDSMGTAIVYFFVPDSLIISLIVDRDDIVILQQPVMPTPAWLRFESNGILLYSVELARVQRGSA